MNINNSAMARAAKTLKLLIDNPHSYKLSTLADEFETVDHEAAKQMIRALRIGGWEIQCDGPPDYTYHVRGYRKDRRN